MMIDLRRFAHDNFFFLFLQRLMNHLQRKQNKVYKIIHVQN